MAVVEGDILLAATVTVAAKADLPTAVAGVITLVTGTTYNWLQPVDLGTDVLEGHDVTIVGDQSLNALITTNNAAALLSSDADGFIILEGMRFVNTGGPLFLFDLGVVAGSYLTMVDCRGGAGEKIGTITSAARVSISGGAWSLFDGGWTFNGEVKELSMHNMSIQSSATGSAYKGVEFTTDADIDTARLSELRFTTGEATDDGLSFHASGTYAQSIKVTNCSHIGLGDFVDASALAKTSPLFDAQGNGVGLDDSVSGAELGVNGNSSETTIATVNVAVRVGKGQAGHGLFVTEEIEDFTLAGAETQLQELTYNGLLSGDFRIEWTASVSRAGTGLIVVQPAIQVDESTIPDSEANFGVDAQTPIAVSSSTTVTLASGADIQLVIANETDDTNLVVQNAKWSVTRVG